MGVDNKENLVASLRDLAGDGLRVVATYTHEGYDATYVRSGIEPRLERLAPEIHEDLVLQGIGKEYLEGLFEAGDLHCSMHRFDEVTVFHFLSGSDTGLLVTLDSDADVPLCTFADACEDYL